MGVDREFFVQNNGVRQALKTLQPALECGASREQQVVGITRIVGRELVGQRGQPNIQPPGTEIRQCR